MKNDYDIFIKPNDTLLNSNKVILNKPIENVKTKNDTNIVELDEKIIAELGERLKNIKFSLKHVKDETENKKLFLIVGDKDPVGENAKQVKKLHKLYIKKGVDSKLKIYPDCRHELINELNKNEVYNDCLSFFNE